MNHDFSRFYILNVKMQGFKRFKEEYEVSLDKMTAIFGGNGQGKTTIADAIAYAFCGTPFWGDKSCDRLQNPDCKEMSVEVQLVDNDGVVHTLSRRRSGGSTAITFDALPARQADLSNMFAERDVFLSLLNPLYFIEKIAADGREFLQRLLPAIGQAEVMERLSDSTRTALENESLLDPDYYMKQKREQIKALDEETVYTEGQIDLLKKQSAEAESKLDAVIEKGEKLIKRKEELEKKQFYNIDVEALRQRQQKLVKNNSDDERKRLLSKQAEIRQRQYESKFAAEITKMKTQYDALAKQYQGLTAKIKGIKVGEVCPVCRTAVTESNYPDIIASLKRDLAAVSQRGKDTTDALKELLELDKKSRGKFEEFKADDLKNVEAELSKADGGELSEIAVLEDRIKLGNLTHAEFDELTELCRQADAYAKEVEVLCETEKNAEKVAELEKALAGHKACKTELMNLIHAAGEFAAARAELTLSRLQMNHAAIKLFDVVKTTGEVKNVFKFTYDGKDYRWLSASEKVKAGLEVSALLQRLTGLVYPTYIDNAEGITTKLAPVDGQVILAYAKNCPLSVKTPIKQEAEQVKEAA